MRINPSPFLALALCGCATSALQMAPSAPDRPWMPAVDASGALVARPASSSSSASPGYVLPPDPAAAVLPPITVDTRHVYDLAGLIDLAESSNPDTRIAWDDARNAALAAGVARSAYLPRISATVLGGRETGHGGSSAFGVSANQSHSVTGSVSVLSLQWLLFDFGRRKALVDAADQNTVIADIGFTGAHQQLIHAVSLAFYAYSAARARAASATASLKDARDIQRAAESRKKRGIGTVMEVAQARQLAAQAELAEVRADGDVSDSYVALLSAMGMSPLARIRIADISGGPLPPDVTGPVDRIVDGALARRPDVLAALAAQKAAAAGVRAARADFLPRVFVSASGSHASGHIDLDALPAVGDQAPTVNVSNHHWGATVMVGVAVPLYSGGTRHAALAQALNREDSAAATLDRVRLGATRQVVTTYSALRTSLAAVAAAKSLMDASQTTYDAALASFRHGVGTSTDVLSAERQLLEARNASVDAHSAALSAAATLAFACGRLGSAPR